MLTVGRIEYHGQDDHEQSEYDSIIGNQCRSVYIVVHGLQLVITQLHWYDPKLKKNARLNGRAMISLEKAGQFLSYCCRFNRIGKVYATRTGRPFCTPGDHLLLLCNTRIAAAPVL